MRPRTVANAIIILLVVVSVLVFLLANRHVMMTPTELNFVVARLTAPLAVLILLMAGTIFALDFIVHAVSRHAWFRERRTLADEIEQLRLRVDRAEESRIAELREILERECAAMRAQLDRVLASLPRT